MYAYVGGKPVNWGDALGLQIAEPGDAIGDLIASYGCAAAIGVRSLKPEWFGLPKGTGGNKADHCRVACQIEKECGNSMGWLAAYLVEVIENPLPTEWDRINPDEIRAGEEGAELANNNKCVDCKSACDKLYP